MPVNVWFNDTFWFICLYFSAGGLVTAVAPVVIKGNGLWVGWPGIHSKEPLGDIPESDPTDQTPTAGLRSDQVCDHFTHKSIYTHRRRERLK